MKYRVANKVILGSGVALLTTSAMRPAAPGQAHAGAAPGARSEAGAPRLASAPRSPSGIPFGPFHLPEDQFRAPFSGVLRNGSRPDSVVPVLEAARKAGFKVVLNMFVSRGHVQNPDGSFSLERWKQRIDRFRTLNLEPYIADGTLVGNYLLDEPDSRGKWNGKPVPFEDIEAAAQYSKSIWPGLATFVRAQPGFLKQAPFRWTYLDAAWAQYSANKGDVARYARTNADQARALGLGLVVGLNVLDGGDGSSGEPGTKHGRWVMSADEVRRYGYVLASEPYACGFFMWKYDRRGLPYFEQTPIKAAMAYLSLVAARRSAAPCRVH